MTTTHITEADRLLSRARAAARRALALHLGQVTAGTNLAADRVADAILTAIGYRDPNQWPTREEMLHAIESARAAQ